MKRILILVIATLLLARLSWAEDRRLDKSRLVIMTFNAQFLWDGIEPEEGAADFPWKNSQTDAEEHMRRIAEVIRRSNPDVINLVEVENLTAVATLNQKFLAGYQYAPYLIEGTDTATGQDVALLTRIDPDGPLERYNQPGTSGTTTKIVSKNYLAKFTISGTKLALIGIHLLAQPNREDRKEQRQAQADAIRTLTLQLRTSGYQPIVLGDFNDYDGALDAIDQIDSQPISNVLATIRGLSLATSTDDLISAASLIPKHDRYTSHWDRNDNGHVDAPTELTGIDHVLLDPRLQSKITAVRIDHTHNPTEVSDHFPIVLTLALSSTPAVTPTGAATLKIFSLLPNPLGNENQNETATLKNNTSQPIDLHGWTLRDLAGEMWQLDNWNTIPAGQTLAIKRNGQRMSLNNNGDTIELRDPNGKVIHTMTYGTADENEVITPIPN